MQTRFLLALPLSIAYGVFITNRSVASASDFICYMETTSGEIIDLIELCSLGENYGQSRFQSITVEIQERFWAFFFTYATVQDFDYADEIGPDRVIYAAQQACQSQTGGSAGDAQIQSLQREFPQASMSFVQKVASAGNSALCS